MDVHSAKLSSNGTTARIDMDAFITVAKKDGDNIDNNVLGDERQFVQENEKRVIPHRYTIASGDACGEFLEENEKSSPRPSLSKPRDKYLEDTYSFIALNGPENNWLCWADRKRFFFFLFGLIPFVFQMTLLMVLVWSQTDETRGTIAETDNPDKEKDGPMSLLASFVPSNANPIVRTAQVTAIATYVIFADSSLEDLIRATQCFPYSKADAPVRSMRFACVLKGIQAALAVTAVLLLILTSNTVVDIILNFTAINFISDIDDHAFRLAIGGEFNEDLEAEAERISKTDLPPCLFTNKSSRNYSKFIVSCVVAVLLFGTMAFVSATQDSMDFWVTQILRVEFQESTGLKPYSGCFMMDKRSSVQFSRRTYHSHDMSATNTSLGYCRAVRQWLLYEGSTSNPCDAQSSDLLLARSSKTDNFDISASFDESWFSASNTPLNMYFFDSNGNDAVIEEHCDFYIGDGSCDIFFNELGYSFDGGDCCAATCSQPTCGRGGLTSVFGNANVPGDGFENCIDPAMFPITIHLNNITSSRNSRFTGFTDHVDASYKVDSSYWPDSERFERWMEEPPVPSYLSLDCNGKNIITAYIEESMVGGSQTVMVEDGATCTLVLRNTTFDEDIGTDDPIWMVDYTIYHGGVDGVEILTGSSSEKDTVVFSRIPECYFRKLRDEIDLDSIYTGSSTSNKAINWLLEDGTGNSDCEDPNFIERYALLNTKFAMNTFSMAVDFIGTEEQCRWQPIICTEGNVGTVNFKRFELESLPQEVGSLSNLESLTTLDLSFNKLSSLPSEIGSLSSLQRLDLSENEQLGFVPTEIGGLSSLEELNLRENDLKSLPSEIGSLSSLQELNLRRNDITSMPTQIGRLSNLKVLTLSYNDLGYLPTEVGALSNLEVLRLDVNRLSSLPTEIVNLSNLKELGLDGIDSSFLPTEITTLSSLEILDLSFAGLTSLSTEIGRLTNLQQLYLEELSQLTYLPTEIGRLSSLSQLNLNDNNLRSLPSEITNLSSLQSLNLAANSLTSLPTEIGSLSDLQEIHLSYNDFTSLPPEIKKLSNLKEFDLDYNANRLTNLTDIWNLPNLQKLSLVEMQISKLPTEIARLSKLEALYLNDNELTILPAEIGSLTSLKELHLYRNLLTTIPPEIENLTNLYELHLGASNRLNFTYPSAD